MISKRLRGFKNKNIERIFLSVGTQVSLTMPTVCVRTVIIRRVGLRKPSTAVTQIELYMLRVSARIAIFLFITNAREIPEKRVMAQKARIRLMKTHNEYYLPPLL